MSRIKDLLPEGYDATDPNELDGTPDVLSQDQEDLAFYLWRLEDAIQDLADHKQSLTPKEIKTLEKGSKKLLSLVQFINKPF